MRKRRAVTHADLAPGPRSTDLSSKTAALLMVLTILCGLFCFILCLFAEATRSQATWVSDNTKGNVESNNQCTYSGSGKTPLMCAAIAFVGLAVAMVAQHMYILIAISKSSPPALVSWDQNPDPTKSLTCQAGLFFVTTWICFGVGEILLLIGVSVESGHLRNWGRPRPSCLVIKEGLFASAGVFALLTVFLAAGLYLTALRAQRISQQHESMRQEMLEASVLFASPPRSPQHRMPMPPTPRENPVSRDYQIDQPQSLAFPPAFGKSLLYLV